MERQIGKTVVIDVPAATVWEYLTNPDCMKKWMGEPGMKIEIITDWKVGNPIVIRGFHHTRFENRGVVLRFEPYKILEYTHLSSVSRLVDRSENYTIISFNLTSNRDVTSLTLKVGNFPTEAIFKHLDFYWKTTVEIIKRTIEASSSP
jgi:uncharacterized protein YndB with AHSA1/START domain